jgi:hypothetical protein
MANPNTTRPEPDALTCPLDEICWKPPRFSPAFLAVAAVGVASIGIGVATAYGAPNSPRLAPNQACDHVTVKRGDTVWAIAGKAGITLDVVARLNPHIPNLSLIYENDEVVTGCPAPPPVVNEVQKVQKEVVVNVDRWLHEPGNVVSREAVLAALYTQGARGNQLIGLASVADPESGRRLDAKGDVDIATGKWDYSAGIFQIRGVKAERGKGTTRDVERCHTLLGGALSAIELFNQALERGSDPLSPWSVHLNGWDIGHQAEYRELATSMGLL